ncbi:MAG: 4-(cytidine 5'-diphospho)-2-C-methyl-D-erythritol kinase [Elusimicrobia bacterium]|nr:4-(cytidine 5'-diphospho)-2-C-methyl-D-erythritol kinase [Elusimicrobiota bacterium]
MKLKANAKINLFLDVLGKRKDGYHNIKTIFQEISLFDDIFIRETKNRIKIFCDHPKVPTDKRNLVYKAVDLIKKRFKIKKDIEIKIKKRIPVGAGLGGGSSDAAAVLGGLNKLWNLKLDKNQLAKIGKKLGADVPFFIYGGRCLGEGIGDKLMPLKIRKTQWYVIVKPPFEISTKNIYLRLTKTRKTGKIKKYINRLEDVVIPLYPEIKKIKEKLVDYGAEFSLMSGSGSCVFGFVKNKSVGEKIKNKMKKAGYAVWLVHSVEGSKWEVGSGK